MSMSMGYYYDEPKKGKGFSITVHGFYRGGGNFYLGFVTKKSADELKRQFISEGFSKDDIEIEKNKW